MEEWLDRLNGLWTVARSGSQLAGVSNPVERYLAEAELYGRAILAILVLAFLVYCWSRYKTWSAAITSAAAEKAQAKALQERNVIERERNKILERFLTAYELQAGILPPVEKRDAPSEVAS